MGLMIAISGLCSLFFDNPIMGALRGVIWRAVTYCEGLARKCGGEVFCTSGFLSCILRQGI